MSSPSNNKERLSAIDEVDEIQDDNSALGEKGLSPMPGLNKEVPMKTLSTTTNRLKELQNVSQI